MAHSSSPEQDADDPTSGVVGASTGPSGERDRRAEASAAATGIGAEMLVEDAQEAADEAAQDAAETALIAILLALLLSSGAGGSSGMGSRFLAYLRTLAMLRLTYNVVHAAVAPVLKPMIIGSLSRAGSPYDPRWGTTVIQDQTGPLGDIADEAIAFSVSQFCDALPAILERIIDTSPDERGSDTPSVEHVTETAAARAARVISVTALNRSKQEAAGLFGYVSKVWRTQRDARVRLSHAFAEGQRRNLDEPFMVGLNANIPMMHPGDRSAPIGEWINCRCLMILSRRPVPTLPIV